MKKILSILIPVISIICVIGLVLWGMKGKESNTEITEKNESVDESEIESTIEKAEKSESIDESEKESNTEKPKITEKNEKKEASDNEQKPTRQYSYTGAQLSLKERSEGYIVYTDGDYDYYEKVSDSFLSMITKCSNNMADPQEEALKDANNYVKRIYPEIALDESGWQKEESGDYILVDYKKEILGYPVSFIRLMYDSEGRFMGGNFFVDALAFTIDEKNAIDENKAIELAKTYVESYIVKEKESGVTFSAKSMADYKASAKPNAHGGLVYWYVTFELDKADDEQPAGYICELNAIDGSLSYVDKTK